MSPVWPVALSQRGWGAPGQCRDNRPLNLYTENVCDLVSQPSILSLRLTSLDLLCDDFVERSVMMGRFCHHLLSLTAGVGDAGDASLRNIMIPMYRLSVPRERVACMIDGAAVTKAVGRIISAARNSKWKSGLKTNSFC